MKDKTILYFDVETQKLADEVGGWEFAPKMGVSYVGIYDSRSKQYDGFKENELDKLFDLMKKADLIVGFNILRFDFHVLSAYSDCDFWKLPNFDILVQCVNELGHRVSLDNIAKGTLDAKKMGDGTLAVKWYKEGNLSALAEYCIHDVKITRDVFVHACREGFLLYHSNYSADNDHPPKRMETGNWSKIVRDRMNERK